MDNNNEVLKVVNIHNFDYYFYEFAENTCELFESSIFKRVLGKFIERKFEMHSNEFEIS